MPRKRGLISNLAHSTPETILPQAAYQLTLEERQELRRIYESSAFKKAWANAKLGKPTALHKHDLSGPTGAAQSLIQLSRIQGWELFEAALLCQINDPAPAKKPVPEDFPDSGVEIVNPLKLPQPPPPPPRPLYEQPPTKDKK